MFLLISSVTPIIIILLPQPDQGKAFSGSFFYSFNLIRLTQ